MNRIGLLSLFSSGLKHALKSPINYNRNSSINPSLISAGRKFFSETKQPGTTEESKNNGQSTSESEQGKGKEENEKSISKLEATLAEKEAKIKEVHNSYLTALADMENLRTRTRKEVENASAYSISKFAKDILNVSDVLEIALQTFSKQELTAKSAGEQQNILKDLTSGIELTHSELMNTMKRYGVEPFGQVGDAFDPNIHMANFEVPSKETGAAKVIDVQKKGYKIKERLLREAHVGISKPSSS